MQSYDSRKAGRPRSSAVVPVLRDGRGYAKRRSISIFMMMPRVVVIYGKTFLELTANVADVVPGAMAGSEVKLRTGA